jgi:nicotinic acetylcholine receptor
MVHVNLFFRRRTLFYSFNLITPGIMISILSILVFILPPGSGEKIGLRINNLVFRIQYE